VGDYTLTLESNLQSQELDTRATTGVVYWEGSNRVTGFAGVKLDPDTGEQIAGTPVIGDAYVEMTRYDLVAN
jgi:predicted secreted hydrolase